MSISDLKFETADFASKGIASLEGNSFVGQASALKAKFDEIGKTMLALGSFNDLIDALLAVTDGSSGADNIGITAIAGVTGATVQAALESLKAAIDAAVLGEIPDASLTDAKLSDAAGQIKQRVTGRNLLHNWDFRNPVNQRGASSYSGGYYTIDRWKWSANHSEYTVTIHDGYITFANDYSTGYAYKKQVFEKALSDGTYTVSVETSDGEIHSKAITISDGSAGSGLDIGNINVSIATTHFEIRIPIDNSVSISSVKLELGSVSTLANDPPADYGEQLALCQRYYQIFITEALRPTYGEDHRPAMRTSSPTQGTLTVGEATYYYSSSDL